MEEAARKFARRIIAIHAALLLCVCLIVVGASREVYNSTRHQATEQAKGRQALLAAQTARGIESFYQAIFDDLDLLRQAETDHEDGDGTAPAAPASGSQPAATKPAPTAPLLNWKEIFSLDPRNITRNAALRPLFSSVLWRQLGNRATHLFIVDRREMNRPERPEGQERTGDRRGDRPGRNPITILGPPPPESQKYGLHPRDIATHCRDWLAGVGRPTISNFQFYDTPHGKVGLNLICVPMSERNPRVLVAAVNILTPQSRFMDKVNTDADATVAVMLDDEGTVMVAASPDQVGRRVMDMLEEEFKPLARQYMGTGRRGTETINRPHRMGNRDYPPGLFTIEPVRVADKRWTLMMISPLSDVDLVVSRIFQKAVFWAIFVVCSMTAILFSTSLQLIRGRARMERLRNDVLTRELTQAREIQLAWLPRDKITVPQIDIAAINHPASHISGDFYNWFELPDGRTVVTIGDVTGHGMGAAFLMATTQLLVHSTMLRLQDPGKTLQEVNDQLARQVFSGQFVTMLICVLDVDRGRLEIATAGHEAPILGDNGRFVRLPIEYHLVLGIERDVEYKTERYDLPPSASLILFTDGVTDARAIDGKRFDMERLIDTLNAARAESAQQLIDSIVGRINQFRQTRELPDDLTLVCIQTLGERAYRATAALSV